MNIDKLKRRLSRLKTQRDDMEIKHIGNELKFTYCGGYELGYIKGKIAEIEEIIAVLEEAHGE